MNNTRYVDTTGLSPEKRNRPRVDLAVMVQGSAALSADPRIQHPARGIRADSGDRQDPALQQFRMRW